MSTSRVHPLFRYSDVEHDRPPLIDISTTEHTKETKKHKLTVIDLIINYEL